MRAANGIRASFRQPEVAYLARAHQLGHRADGFFDWRLGVNAVLIIEIDAIYIEPAETRVARLFHVLRFAVDSAEAWCARIPQDAEFRRDDDAMPFAADAASEQLFVGVGSVNVGSIEKSDPELDRAFDRSKRFRIVAIAIKL